MLLKLSIDISIPSSRISFQDPGKEFQNFVDLNLTDFLKVSELHDSTLNKGRDLEVRVFVENL